MPFECVLKCGKPCKSSDIITQGKWDSLQSKTQNSSGLYKFGDVYNTTLWQDGPGSHYIHHACYISISSSVMLEKARQRKNKERNIAKIPSSEMQADSSLCDDEPDAPLPSKRLHSSVGGPLHDKTKCVWCMQGVDVKHPNRARGTWFRLNTPSAWRAFKRHTVTIEDDELRDRLTRLVESTSALSDPFANDIMYHYACWQKHVQNQTLKPEDALHLQNVSLSEARNFL